MPNTRIHIEYSAHYPRAFHADQQPKGRLWILGLEGKPGLVDYGHFFKVEEGTVTLQDSTITLRLYPRGEPMVNSLRVDLADLTLKVRLDVNGDGDPTQGGEDATLIVPTTKQGKKWPQARTVMDRAVDAELQPPGRGWSRAETNGPQDSAPNVPHPSRWRQTGRGAVPAAHPTRLPPPEWRAAANAVLAQIFRRRASGSFGVGDDFPKGQQNERP